MAKIQTILKALVPPILFWVIRKFRPSTNKEEIWSGNYSSWEEANALCTGYDSASILEKCKSALLKIKNGEAVYERDSILFDRIEYSWGLLAGLQKAALENNGKLCVLDFGGSLGSSYYQNKGFLNMRTELNWCVVEQPHFVDCGKEFFANHQLNFYHTLEECMAIHRPNVFLLSSVLQYLENPMEMIDKVLNLGIPYVIVDRLALSDNTTDILTIQTVSKRFYESKLSHWFFSYNDFVSKFNPRYTLIASSPSAFDSSIILNAKIECYFNLLIFQKK